MIKNERQYKLTRAQLAEFEKTIRDLEQQGYRESTDVLQRAELGALESQLSDLMQDISEYESLREAPPPVIEGANLDELPRALIRARIALGLSQKALADKMGLKEQQVQRYEATNYESASLSRLQEIARALGVHVSERISLPLVARSREALYSRLDTVGIDREFLLGRILPTDIAFGLEREEGAPDNVWIPQAHRILERVFGWTDNQLLAAEPLALPQESTATARFKIPAGAQGRRLGAYVAYAHYLAMVVASGVDHLPQSALETDPTRMREALLTFGPTMSLKTVMNFFWDHGIPVIALNDAGAFHGACWRLAGRNVICIKQRTRFTSRWIFDLLHEWHHAAQAPGERSHAWIEDSELTSTRRTSPEEQAANKFAGDVLLKGRAEAMVAECVTGAKGRIPSLKAVVVEVARRHEVLVDHLANYLAWRLSLQGENWWGAASNLQTDTGDPFGIAQDVFLERFDFTKVNEIDARILHRALTANGDGYV